MAMDSIIDYSTLNWVKEEIDETMKQARLALEEYVEDQDDATQLRFCLTYIHQVYGTLQMVELYGASLFAEEMEQLIQALLDNEVSQKNDAYEVLMRAILQLPDYLERIQGGMKDNPLILMPIMNDLRTARGASLLSESALFAPDLNESTSIDLGESIEFFGVDPKALAKKLRPLFQIGLLGWYRDKGTADSLKKIIKVLTQLEQVCSRNEVVRLWWVAKGIAESLLRQGVEGNITLKLLLGQVDREIKRLIDLGEQELSSKPAEELLKNLLYYVAQSKPVTPRIQEIKKKYNLSIALATGEDVESARESLAGPNAQLMETVSIAISEDLSRVKDALDLLLRSDERDLSTLEPQIEILQKMADTLGMLGMGVPRKVIQEQVGVIGSMMNGTLEPDESRLMEIAGALLFVESSLVGLVESSHAEEEQGRTPAAGVSTDVTLATGEMRQIQDTVLKEITVEIAKSKDAIIAFIDAPMDYDQLNVVPGLFETTKGGMRMMGLDHAAKLVEAASEYITSNLMTRKNEPSQQDLDNIADVISSIEYYLEAVRENRPNQEAILSVTSQSLKNLGYTPDSAISDEPTSNEFIFDTVESRVDTSTTIDNEDDAEATLEFAQGMPEGSDETHETHDTLEIPEPVSLLDIPAPIETPDEVESPTVMPVEENIGLPDDIDDDILEIFIEESEEVLESIKENLPLWKQNFEDHDSLSNIRRSFHTLKGSGRLVGALTIGEFAWSIESMLNRILDGTLAVTNSKLELLDDVVAALPSLIGELKGEGKSSIDIAALITRAENEVQGDKVATALPEDVLIEDAKQASDRDEDIKQEQASIIRVMDPVLYEIFSKESKGHINVINEFLGAVSNRTDENSLVDDALVRALHTLHGSARMAGAEDIAEVAGTFEKYAKILHENESPVNAGSQSLIKEGVVVINEMLELINKSGEPQADINLLLNKVTTLYNHELHKQEERLQQEQEQTLSQASEEHIEESQDEEFDREVVEIFIEEGAEILDSSEVILQRLSENMQDSEAITELQRELHTLKGGARMAGINAIGDLSHAVESVLTAVAEEGLLVTENMVNTLHRSIDCLIVMLDMAKKDQPLSTEQSLIAELESIRKNEPVSTEAPIDESVYEAKDTEEEMAADLREDTAEIIDFSQARDAQQEQSVDELVSILEEQDEGEELILTEIVDEEETAQEEQEELVELEALELTEDIESSEDVEQPEIESLELSETTDLEAQGEEVEEQPESAPIPELVESKAAEIPPPIPAALPEAIEPVTQTIGGEMVRVRSDLLDNLVNYAGEVSIFRSRLEQQIGAFRYNLVEMDQTVDRLREQLRNLEIETEAQILFRYEQEHASDENFDPLELDRYSTMQQLSRALMETTADIGSIQNLMDGLVRESETLMIQQARVNTDLQEGLMRTRMVSFSGSIPRLQRIMRQTSQELNKKVKLNVTGERGELDRNVLERITAPLEHMIRNALSHGIESPKQRKAAGKSSEGKIDLSITREGSEIVLSLEDDGAGMNLEAIRTKAKERGLLKDDSQLSDNDIMQFILESGFSTAEKVTQISGRGVGMDVVNSEIKQLGGSLNIASEPGKGSKFVIRLPLTLALNHALLVRVSDETYAIPLTSIEGIVRMSQDELQQYQSDANSVYQYAGSDYQVKSLGAILHAQYSGFQSAEKLLPVLLVRSGDHQTALQVDALMGSREIVVKSVGPQLSTLRGVSGATILGDGSVVLILDMGSIIRLSAAMSISEADTVAEKAQEERKLNVMVVDDSITVRKVTTRLLERNDMNVITAKDGVDAVATLHDHIPDIMLLDIEMPRMDGFELATYMRNEPRLKDIPIIMITSRTGDKHRRRAEEIGVQRYLGKPYQEHDLLENINSVIEAQHGIA